MSDTFRKAIEQAYSKGWHGRCENRKFDTEIKTVANAIMQEYPCESAAQKLLKACESLLETLCAYVDTDNVINADIVEPVREARAAMAEADPNNAVWISPEMDALMEIYKLSVNTVSEQGCTYDVDFICLINKMKQIAKDVLQKSEADEYAT